MFSSCTLHFRKWESFHRIIQTIWVFLSLLLNTCSCLFLFSSINVTLPYSAILIYWFCLSSLLLHCLLRAFVRGFLTFCYLFFRPPPFFIWTLFVAFSQVIFFQFPCVAIFVAVDSIFPFFRIPPYSFFFILNIITFDLLTFHMGFSLSKKLA